VINFVGSLIAWQIFVPQFELPDVLVTALHQKKVQQELVVNVHLARITVMQTIVVLDTMTVRSEYIDIVSIQDVIAEI
jgi:hypothetical protein